MRFFSTLLFALIAVSGEARRDPRHAGKAIADKIALAERNFIHAPVDMKSAERVQQVKRQGATIIPQTDAIKKFIVDGTKIPDGGPGCSSLEGFLQENGPFLWQYGTFKPVKNPWSWHTLTNMIWVEQPVGTGFSQGQSTETTQEAVAASFLGFLKNFEQTFNFKNKKIYITGESYAGMFVPYIADAMFNSKDKEHFDVQGTMIYDGGINQDSIMQEIPAFKHVKDLDKFFNLNDTTMADLTDRAEKCGYTKYLADHLVYPPKAKLPTPPPTTKDCELWSRIKDAAVQFNPCFNIYDIATTCPNLWDVLGFPGSFTYLPSGATIYFNRTDVQKAINAPIQSWNECGEVALDKDGTSIPSSLTILPSVIERSKRTIIAHGNLDYILLKDGSLLTIQNMTWNGKQGFQTAPKSDFYVPYHKDLNIGTTAGSGVMGVTHTERGLTWVEVFMSGHMVPQYQPSAAYRQMEFLLGRIKNLNEVSAFTTQPGVPQTTSPLKVQRGYNDTYLSRRELFGM
ncbi:carboxypeptidase D [Venturia nashicola]|nr:carboxypeptidase D [Venturia nashicola]